MNFSEKEALMILEATTISEVEDQYEQKVFEWKQKYLSALPPVLLIKSQIKKIERLNAAASLFMSMPSVDLHLPEKIDIDQPLVLYFKAYHQRVMQLKLGVSSAINGWVLIQYLNQLIANEEQLYRKLLSYYPDQAFQSWDLVKRSAVIDVFEAEQELTEKDIAESEIMDYLRGIFAGGAYPYQSVLANLMLKAHKIANHGH